MFDGRMKVELSEGTKSFFGRLREAFFAGTVYALRLFYPTYGIIATGIFVADKLRKVYTGLKNYISYKKEDKILADAYGYDGGTNVLGAAMYLFAPATLSAINLGLGALELYRDERYSLGHETIKKHKESEEKKKPDESK